MQDRLESLDAFRGLTIAGMILVNTPGTWSAVYAPLLHAEWHGWTPTDLIFPFFVFIVGVALPYSFDRYLAEPAAGRPAALRRVLRRSALIFLIGLLLNALPALDLEEVRIPGVLQRIALAYLGAALATLYLSRRRQVALCVALLLGYHALLMWVPWPGHLPGDLTPDGNLGARLDRALLGVPHLWQNREWDPEGLLSTLPAIATCLLGVFTGRLLRSGRERAIVGGWMFVAGWLLILAGLAWDPWLPINKNLWSSSFVLFTAGAALQVLATCFWLIDVAGCRRWAAWAVTFGRNPLTVYVVSIVATKALLMVRLPAADGTTSLYAWLYRTLLASWMAPMNASLAFAAAAVAGMWLVAALLQRRGLMLRV